MDLKFPQNQPNSSTRLSAVSILDYYRLGFDFNADNIKLIFSPWIKLNKINSDQSAVDSLTYFFLVSSENFSCARSNDKHPI